LRTLFIHPFRGWANFFRAYGAGWVSDSRLCAGGDLGRRLKATLMIKNDVAIEVSKAVAVGFGLGRRLKPTLLKKNEIAIGGKQVVCDVF
jgi:hypothetical protein